MSRHLLFLFLNISCKTDVPDEPTGCGAPFSDDCVVMDEGCIEPNPLECTERRDFDYFRNDYLSILRGSEQSELPGWCHPGFIALCDDPDYFVTASELYDDIMEVQVWEVESSACVGNFIAVPESHQCRTDILPYYVGLPSLEDCARKARSWVRSVHEECDPRSGTPCDNTICIVDETR